MRAVVSITVLLMPPTAPASSRSGEQKIVNQPRSSAPWRRMSNGTSCTAGAWPA
jgi:hypothetical protein